MAKKTPVFDAHHHLWDLQRCHYPWLEAKGVTRFFGDPTPIQRNYLAKDLLDDARTLEIAGTTHVQVGVSIEDSVKETEFVQEVASENPNVGNAIVAYTDLTKPNFETQLDRHSASSNFRGVRQIIGRHPVEDANSGTGFLLDDRAFVTGLATLARRNLSFDLQLIEANYAPATSVLKNVPDLKFAICHFGSPWDLSKEGFVRWRRAMAALALIPGAHMKFSGFGMFKSDWRLEDIRPYVETALELFGEDRCFAGSNFPVDKLYGVYDRIWLALAEIVGEASAYRKVTLENARRFYRV